MRLERFVRERAAGWAELDALLARARGRPERLEPARIRRLGALYRAAAADLALARRTFPRDPIVARLEALVVRGRQAVYGDESRGARLRGFLTDGYWRRVCERPVALLVATLLLLAPMALAAVWALDDPAAALGLVPEQFRGASEPGNASGPGSLTLDQQAGLSSEIFTNNIRVTFLAVAGGMLLGLATAGLVLYNGAFIGAIGGLASQSGGGERFFELVLPHGVLELSCIVVGATAGLRLGWSIVEPGLLTRGESLRQEALRALELVLGTMPWLVLAGLVEGFVTGSLPGLTEAVVVGAGLGVVYWALVIWRGALPLRRARL